MNKKIDIQSNSSAARRKCLVSDVKSSVYTFIDSIIHVFAIYSSFLLIHILDVL